MLKVHLSQRYSVSLQILKLNYVVILQFAADLTGALTTTP